MTPTAQAAATELLAALGEEPSLLDVSGLVAGPGRRRDPHAAWAASGLGWLTGERAGPPLLPGRDHLGRLDGVLATVDALGRAVRGHDGPWADLDHRLLVERAAAWGWGAGGMTSCGGTCRLVATADGWLAVQLARPDDVEAVPAWLEHDIAADDPWATVAAVALGQAASALAERGQLLGIPVAVVESVDDEQLRARWPLDPASPGPLRLVALGQASGAPRVGAAPLVVDLTSLWAGPLCAHLLGRAGARVVKVESTRRPDGARRGPPVPFDVLHHGHRAVAVDLASEEGRADLHAMVAAADVVLEGSRPRALEQLGLSPEGFLAERPGRIWVALTAYGRSGPWAQRVGFGDDTAACAGLVVAGSDGRPRFCGDALADPTAGLLAAAGALSSWRRGGGTMVDVALREAAAFVARAPEVTPAEVRRSSGPSGGWEVAAAGGPVAVVPPIGRPVVGPAPDLGADTRAVLAEVAGYR